MLSVSICVTSNFASVIESKLFSSVIKLLSYSKSSVFAETELFEYFSVVEVLPTTVVIFLPLPFATVIVPSAVSKITFLSLSTVQPVIADLREIFSPAV